MERDNEIYGAGNSYTAEFWQYDSRIGRRWNTDPVVKYHESPYVAFNDNPIIVADTNGDDGIVITEQGKKRTTLIIKADYHYIKGQFDENALSAVKKEFSSYKKMNYNGEK